MKYMALSLLFAHSYVVCALLTYLATGSLVYSLSGALISPIGTYVAIKKWKLM